MSSNPDDCFIAADNAAVVVVDVQAGLFATDPPPYEGEKLIQCINGITTKARAANVPVFFIQQDGSAEENLEPLTAGWRLHQALRVEPHDRLIRKTTCDAFYKSQLETELRHRNAKTVVIMGYATDFCIDATIRNAASKEFEVVIVEDGHTTTDSPYAKADTIRKHHNWAWTNCVCKKTVRVLPSAELSFSAG